MAAVTSPGFAAIAVQAQNGQFDKNDVENAAELRQRAQSAGTDRLELVLRMPPSVAAQDIFTDAGLQARTASVTQLVSSFKQAHLAYLPGSFVSATLTPFIDADVTPAGIDALMQNPDVLGFSDTTFYKEALKGTNIGLETALLPPVPVGGLGNTMIAFIDSGIDATHPGFQSRVILGGCSSTSDPSTLPSICSTISAGGPCASTSSITGMSDALSNCGHGTHVAGIAASANGTQATSGMMPNVGIISYQASSLRLDSQNRPARTYRNIDLLRGMQFAFTNRNFQGRKLVALNMSIGSANFAADSSECNGIRLNGEELVTINDLRQAIANLRTAGVSVVAATGNETAGMAFPACATIGNPPVRTVISVSATQKNNLQADYSQNGFDANFVASILAPGGVLTQAGIPGCAINADDTAVCSPSFKHSAPVNMGQATFELREGTSMAAPHVTGILARLRERFPNATRAQIEATVISTGVPTAITGYTPGMTSGTAFPTVIPRMAPFPAFRQATLPQTITASTATCGQINISWTAPSIMVATEYRVRFASTAAGLAAAAQTPLANTVTNFSIAATQQQFFQVIARDVTGDGVWSSVGSAVPLPCAPNAVSNAREYGAPTNPICITGIQWDANVGHSGGYEVEEICDNMFDSVVTGTARISGLNLLPFATPACANNGAWAGSVHTFRVRACESLTCGPWTAPVIGGTLDRCSQ